MSVRERIRAELPRPSTWFLLAVFVAALVLYALVRPVEPASPPTTGYPLVVPSTHPTPRPAPSRTARPTRPSPTGRPAPTPAATPTARASGAASTPSAPSPSAPAASAPATASAPPVLPTGSSAP